MTDEGKAVLHAAAELPEAKDAVSAGGSEREIALDELTRSRLGTHLRALYAEIVHQPVPDRFRDLIARLEAGEAEDPAGGDAAA